MGVKGLWQLLEPAGRPVTLESLEGKVLAVDISLWLNQSVRGMRDRDGNQVTNAHLLGLFNRICKMLFYRIKPVFVFDGGAPQLKKQTLAARRQRLDKAVRESNKARDKLLKNYLKQQAMTTVLGKESGTQSGKSSAAVPRSKDNDIYDLPALEPSQEAQLSSDSQNDSWEERQMHQEIIHEHYQNLDSVDIYSEEFKALPAEVQHEIILEMQETKKRHSWANIGHLPKAAGDFSSYQMTKLLQKSKLSQRLDNVRKELNTRDSGEIASFLDFGVDEKGVQAQRVVSEDTQHYILIKGLGKKKNIDESSIESRPSDTPEPTPSTSQEQPSEKDIHPMTSDLYDDMIELDDDDMLLQDLDLYRVKEKSSENVFRLSELESKEPENQNFGADLEFQKKSKPQGSLVESKTILSDNDIIITGELLKKNYFKTDSMKRKIEEIDLTSENEKGAKMMKKDAVLHDNDQKISVEKGFFREMNKDEIEILEKEEDIKSLEGTNTDNTCQIVSPEGEDCVSLVPMVTKDNITVVQEINKDEDKLRYQEVVQDDNNKPQDEGDAVSPVLKKRILTSEIHLVSDIEEQKRADDDDKDESSSEESFIEVTIDPTKINKVDELFPAEIFIPSNDVSEEASKTSSQSDVIDITSQYKKLFDVGKEDSGDAEPAVSEETNISSGGGGDSDDVAIVPEMEGKESDIDEEEAKSPGPVMEWAGKTLGDLASMEAELESEGRVLQAERNKQERLGATITDQMYVEAQELLRLFGLPYIIGPQEAEAQCAFLDSSNQTDGTVTDDSDVWLFGGQRVFKNMFNQRKYVELYTSDAINKQLLLSRDKMIQLAFLVGSDYTEGIAGIGGVTALEVLHEFKGGNLEGLKAFRNWWDEAQKQVHAVPNETKLKSKLRTLTVKSGFPNPAVRLAYLQPAIDESQESFQWGVPDLHQLREFANEKFGWSKTKIDELLLPVMKKLSEKSSQPKISAYFPTEFSTPRKIKSKRVQQVLNRIKRGDSYAERGDEKVNNTTVPKKRGRPSKSNKDNISKDCKEDNSGSECDSDEISGGYVPAPKQTKCVAANRGRKPARGGKRTTKSGRGEKDGGDLKGKSIPGKTVRKTRKGAAKITVTQTEVQLSESGSSDSN
ncbi:DNA excision repair protein ERCC-5 homolog [Glandiceps talaboti]